LEAEDGARSDVEAVGDLVEIALAIDRQVDALGQILPDEAVEVFAGWPLPGAVRIAEVDRHAKPTGQFPLLDVSRNFIASNEFRTNYGTAPDPTSLVSKFYSNVLGRAGDPGGVVFWVGEINRGAEPAQILRQFAESPENVANVSPRKNSGIWLDNYYFIP
jgi:hypothetical protein